TQAWWSFFLQLASSTSGVDAVSSAIRLASPSPSTRQAYSFPLRQLAFVSSRRRLVQLSWSFVFPQSVRSWSTSPTGGSSLATAVPISTHALTTPSRQAFPSPAAQAAPASAQTTAVADATPIFIRSATRLQVAVHQVFEHLLAAGARLRVQLLRLLRQVGEGQLAGEDLLAQLLVPARVALVDEALQLPVAE